jgi:hypothetical protein
LLAPKLIAELGRHQQAQDYRQQLQQQQAQREAEQRQEIEKQKIQQSIAAYDDGDAGARALASLSATSQALKVVKTEGWLEDGVARAQETGAISALPNLANSYLRSIETGARIAGLPGFVPSRSIDGGIEATKFEVNIILGDKVVTVATHSTGSPTVEGNADWDSEDAASSESSSPVIDIADASPSVNSDSGESSEE